MQKVLLFCLVTFSLLNCKGQNHPSLNVSAGYISIYLSVDGNKDSLNFEKIRATPSGNFTCQEKVNGDLWVKFSPHDTTVVWVSADQPENKKGIEKLKKKIGGYSLKGAYLNPSEPFDIFHVIYTSDSNPNSLFIMTYSNIGENILSVALFNDKPLNPLLEQNIRFNLMK